MASTRSLLDSRGVRWEVEEDLARNGDMRCLRFTSPAETREFGLVPDGWRALADADLERLCQKAVVISRA